ncbi:hypothetical protein CRENBAI_026279, partial [Crenichthys baileyi]
MCTMSGGEQAAPSPDALTTEENGSRCDRCFCSPGEEAMRDLHSQRAWKNRLQQLLRHVFASVYIQLTLKRGSSFFKMTTKRARE